MILLHTCLYGEDTRKVPRGHLSGYATNQELRLL
jgi:hypothetical protein